MENRKFGERFSGISVISYRINSLIFPFEKRPIDVDSTMVVVRGTGRSIVRDQSLRDYRKQNEGVDAGLKRSVIEALQKSIDRSRLQKLGKALGKDPNHPATVRFRNAARAALIVLKIDPKRFASDIIVTPPTPPEAEVFFLSD